MSEQNRPPKPPVEDTSFGSLREEMEEVFPLRHEHEVPEHSPTGEPLSLSDQEKLREKKEMEAKINARVLGGSGATTPPMWIRGFVLAATSVALLFFLVFNSGFRMFQPFGSYITIGISVGTVLWCLNGILKDDEPRDKALAAVGAVIGAAVILLAFLNMGS